MKRKLAVILICILMMTVALSFTALAAEVVVTGYCGNALIWRLTDDRTLTIFGNGTMEDYDFEEPAPWSEYTDEIESVVIESGVASIGNNAFYLCNYLESVTIGEGVRSIGDYAFSECTMLGEIDIPSSVNRIGDEAFYNCVSLEKVSIPDGVTSIGTWAFGECKGLTEVSIPNTVTVIEERAFYMCYNLTDVVIPDGVTAIRSETFFGCTNLSSITIPESVTLIGSQAFYDCTKLSDISIPNSVTSIGEYTFAGCNSLTAVRIPGSVKRMGNDTFASCEKLEELIFAGSPPGFGNLFCADDGVTIYYPISDPAWEDVINNCDADIKWKGATSVELQAIEKNSINVSGPAEIVDSGTCGEELVWTLTNEGTLTISGTGEMDDFSDYYNADNGFGDVHPAGWDIKNVKNVVIKEGVTSIGDNAFGDFKYLTSVSIPTSVTDIGKRAFNGCSALLEVKIPSGVTIIIDRTFENCAALKKVELQEGLTIIGDHAFAGCVVLEEILLPESLASIGKYAFESCRSLNQVTIPKSAKINMYAFLCCEGLTELTISEGVQAIDACAFSGCIKLTSVTMPASLKIFGENVFSLCESLTEIRFLGNAPQFGSVYYTDGGVTICYPRNNSTWYEAIEKCESKTNWEEYEPEGGVSVTIEEDINETGNEVEAEINTDRQVEEWDDIFLSVVRGILKGIFGVVIITAVGIVFYELLKKTKRSKNSAADKERQKDEE